MLSRRRQCRTFKGRYYLVANYATPMTYDTGTWQTRVYYLTVNESCNGTFTYAMYYCYTRLGVHGPFSNRLSLALAETTIAPSLSHSRNNAIRECRTMYETDLRNEDCLLEAKWGVKTRVKVIVIV